MKTESEHRVSVSPVSPRSGPDCVSTSVVLVADGDPQGLKVLGDILGFDGFQVVTATDGAQAIRLLKSERPQIVIADVRMPDMDGRELLSRIREIDETVPVIMMAADSGADTPDQGTEQDLVDCVRLGAYDFLQKPIQPWNIRTVIQRTLVQSKTKCDESARIRALEEEFEKKTKQSAELNELLTGILNSSSGVSIVWTDFDQTVRFWNAGAEAIFGYTAEEMQGQKITILYPENTETPEAVETLRRRILVERKTLQGKIKQRTKDGRLVTVSLVISPMLAGSGEVLGILGIGQDVTEEVRLQEDLVDSLRRIHRVQRSAIFTLARLAETRDEETGNHLKRIQRYCAVLCERLRTAEKFSHIMSDRYVDDLVQASVLHDIGKVGIPDRVLFSKERFSPEEYEIMKQHTITGGRALEDAARETGEDRSLLSIGMEVAYNHHERWDGTGYPYGKKGEDIPFGARVVAIVDVYDALTAKRRYKRAYSHEEAIALITENSGKQFDPDLVAVLTDVYVLEQFQAIREELADHAADQEAD